MNEVLLERKKAILNNFKFSKMKFHVAMNFHNIPVRIHSNNKDFIESLKNYLPSSWYQEVNTPIEIFVDTPLKYSIPILEWENEADPDCIEDENKNIIQRDFCAKEFKPNSFYVVCEESLDDGFYNFLRWFIPRELTKYNQVLVHSSCVAHEDNAYLFLGHSTAGKSTTCGNLGSISDDFYILNDDMNIIEQIEGEFFVKPAGIGGLFPLKKEFLEHPVRLKNIFWLNKSNENRIETISPSLFCSKIIASFANIDWKNSNENQTQEIMNFAASLSQIPGGILSLKNDTSFWSEIEKFNRL